MVSATAKQIDVLKSSTDDRQRLQALKYVVHLLADVQQPLHAGHGEDRGGSQYQIQAYGRGTNLHAFWDTALVTNQFGDAPSMAQAIGPVTSASVKGNWYQEMARAADESCQIVASAGLYPARRVSVDDVRRATPTALSRMRLAASRLAAVLNDALGK